MPALGNGPSAHDLVIKDVHRYIGVPRTADAIAEIMAARKEIGLERYGQLLQNGNGRDMLRDAIEEVADALAYTRLLMEKSWGEVNIMQHQAYKSLMNAMKIFVETREGRYDD
jgi:hypothetical protein